MADELASSLLPIYIIPDALLGQYEQWLESKITEDRCNEKKNFLYQAPQQNPSSGDILQRLKDAIQICIFPTTFYVLYASKRKNQIDTWDFVKPYYQMLTV
ncbi:19607_t:CDS:2 [Rhizophagus irregularis]|nr:19607_t:CDS:2 [Rhizophagus irregularis]